MLQSTKKILRPSKQHLTQKTLLFARSLLKTFAVFVFLATPLSFAHPKKLYSETSESTSAQSRRSHYAATLNETFILLRTKPTKDAIEAICGEKGLCHKPGTCRHPLLFSFFWSLCKQRFPGFANLPCATQYAKELSFDLASGTFAQTKNALDYLEQQLFTGSAPEYMRFMLAKIITQSPQHYLVTTQQTRSRCCNSYRQLCRYKPQTEVK